MLAIGLVTAMMILMPEGRSVGDDDGWFAFDQTTSQDGDMFRSCCICATCPPGTTYSGQVLCPPGHLLGLDCCPFSDLQHQAFCCSMYNCGTGQSLAHVCCTQK